MPWSAAKSMSSHLHQDASRYVNFEIGQDGDCLTLLYDPRTHNCTKQIKHVNVIVCAVLVGVGSYHS